MASSGWPKTLAKMMSHLMRYCPHTWGDDDQEVTYEDLSRGTEKSKAGYHKIRFCGEQAARDGLQYFWVDTCCIDKTDAVELQRSINSMFRWYKNAAKCYVYLSDVSIPEDKLENNSNPNIKSVLRTAKWFTRGWTLQELLAPSSVEFFSTDYKRLGDKLSLEPIIHEITGIPVEALQGYDLTKFSVNERVSWIAKRETKHEEDIAYSLVGFFLVFSYRLFMGKVVSMRCGGSGRRSTEVSKVMSSMSFRNPALRIKKSSQYTSTATYNPLAGFLLVCFLGTQAETIIDLPMARLGELRRAGFNLKFHLANVPYIQHFEGREAYLQRLAGTLLPGSDPDQRKLEIVSGLGGIGKTRLAIQFVKLHEDRFSSAFFIDAHSQESISRTFLGIHLLLWGDSNKQKSRIVNTCLTSEVLDWFCLDGNTQWLLIFDNVDRQPSDPDGVDITAFFPPVNRGSILITTRLNPLELDRLSKPQIVLQPMSYDESGSLLNYHVNMVPTSMSMQTTSRSKSRG